MESDNDELPDILNEREDMLGLPRHEEPELDRGNIVV